MNYLFIRECAELRDLIDSGCNYRAETKKMMDLYLGVHNPFCADNRDPGATKNDQYDDVLDEEDVNAAAGTKPSVFLCLLSFCLKLKRPRHLVSFDL